MLRSLPLIVCSGLAVLVLAVGCRPNNAPNTRAGGSDAGTLTVYSGRGEELIGPAIEKFRAATGIDVKVRYAGTSELAGTMLEEGRNSPADVFLAQDAGALGAVAGLLEPLPPEVLDCVESRFRGQDGTWVGLSGRARVVAYNTDRVSEDELPDSIHGFTDPKWKGRIGWAPTNGSFQAFVTALRRTEGDEAARQWLEGVQANQPKVFASNTPIVQAVGAGEVEVGFVNHYYLLRALAEQGESFPVRNYYLRQGDAGSLINVSAAGVLKTTKDRENAHRFLEFLLSEETQVYFATETYEYPLAHGVETSDKLVPLSEIRTPDVDLTDLCDLEQTLELLRETGVLR